MSAGDFDLFVAPDGKAYMVFEQTHSAMIIAKLTDDNLDFPRRYTSHLPAAGMPFAREGAQLFHAQWQTLHAFLGHDGVSSQPDAPPHKRKCRWPWTAVAAPHVGDRSGPRSTRRSVRCSGTLKRRIRSSPWRIAGSTICPSWRGRISLRARRRGKLVVHGARTAVTRPPLAMSPQVAVSARITGRAPPAPPRPEPRNWQRAMRSNPRRSRRWDGGSRCLRDRRTASTKPRRSSAGSS